MDEVAKSYCKGRLSDNVTYADVNNIRGLKRLNFFRKIKRGYKSADKKIKKTFQAKRCYYGPFIGEFGHFLGHNLPFLMFLHSQGVKITFCGLGIYKPFLVDENGHSILHEFFELRDFYGEVSPSSNQTVLPKDVQDEVNRFQNLAQSSNVPFWDISDQFYYYFIHRNWLVDKKVTKVYNLSKVYKTKDIKAVTIFPRKKGALVSENNGGVWDYTQLANDIAPYFDKVYITGHPSMSHEIGELNFPNIEVKLSGNNLDVLTSCANSQLIVSQHSGSVYMIEYMHNKLLFLYKGEPPIGSLQNTLRFKKSLTNKEPYNFAFNNEQVITFVKKFYENYGK